MIMGGLFSCSSPPLGGEVRRGGIEGCAPPPLLASPPSGGEEQEEEESLQRPGPPVAVEAGGHAARQVGPRDRALGEIGCLEDREVAGLVLGAVEHAQEPAVAFGGAVVARHEDRLAEAVVGPG